MSKTITAELKTHLAQETTTTTVCMAMKLHWRSIPVSGITGANPGVVTTQYEHALVTGQYVAFDDVLGMTGINDSAHTQPFNFFQVTVLSATTFEVNADTSGFGGYTSGGIVREVMAFTDSTSPILLDNITYSPSEAFTRSAISGETTLSVDTIDITGLVGTTSSGVEITVGDIVAGRYDLAEVRVFLINYEDLTMGRMWLRRGWIGEVTVTDHAYTAELRGMVQMLQVQTLDVYTANCRFNLGDSRCTIALAPITSTGSVTTVTDNSTFNTGISATDGIFEFGLLTFTSGANTGLSSVVKTFASNQFILQSTMPFTVVTGDNVSVYQGCDKTIETCRTKFSNVPNFGGFPHLPGEDRIIQVIKVRDPNTVP